MFDKYNESLAVQYSSTGKKTAAFNTKLGRSLLLSKELTLKEYTGKPAVLVYPVGASKEKKDALWKKAWQEGYLLRRSVSEPEAAVYFHRIQNRDMMRSGFVNVIDIHKSSTDLTLLSVEKS